LPVLISSLIAGSLVAFLFLAFQQVQQALLRAGEARAQIAADQLANLLAQSAQQRLSEVQRIARDPAVRAYLDDPGDTTAGPARQRLIALTSTGQPAVELWDDAGRRVLTVDPARASAAPPPALPATERPSAQGVTAFMASGQAIYWDVAADVPAAAPEVVAESARAPAGMVLSRRLLTPSGSETISKLVGAGAVIRLGNQSGGPWSDLSRVTASPSVPVRPGVIDEHAPDGNRYLGWAAAIRGTPWIVLLEFPRNTIVAPARTFLLGMLGVVAVLVLAAAAAAYALSARITTPLLQLTHAAEAIADGRFEARVETGRRDEIGRLAIAFQTMATQVQGAQHELELRVAERTTDIRALNTELEQRVGELKALAGELEAFSYSVSHDLRAPLRHVSGFAALLEKTTATTLDDQSRRYVRTISEAATQMGRLIDDLLVFSRMGRAEMLRTRVDLQSLVAEVRDEVQRDAAGKAIEWIVGSLPVVTGDPSMLRLVFVNLLSNAVKYSSTRPRATIEIGTIDAAGETVVFVRDNGVGFDMQHAGNLFGVFQRLHSSEQFEGTGIGLANVRRIVNRHGGRTWAESAPDQGATFFVALPRAETET
jgi:signal transduction histidine kinase